MRLAELGPWKPIRFLRLGSAFGEVVAGLLVVAAAAFAVAAADVIGEVFAGLGVYVADEGHLPAGGAGFLAVASAAVFQGVAVVFIVVLHWMSVCYWR